MTVFALLLIILALCLILFGVVSWTKKLPGNSIIGMRIPEVRKSEETWRAAHAAAGPVWTFGGVALLFGGLIGLVSGGWMWLFTVFTILVAFVALSLGAHVGAQKASLLDTEEDTEEGCGENCNCSAPAETPEVDITALRRAASQADQQ